MPKHAYIEKRFRPKTLAIIETASEIIDEYRMQGFSLTLRQLYYQFVARGLIENTERSYKNLGGIVSDARLAGHLDWYAIEDRTRAVSTNSHWNNPKEILEASAAGYAIDLRKGQETHVEVWVEKDALSDVVDRACRPLDCARFSCRGYVSQSAMWRAAQRIIRTGLDTVILHLGDHDPSGIDMTRDIEDRLELFCGYGVVTVNRIALTMEQIEELNPPPNPAKVTDSRAREYIAEYGEKSWELDALEPAYIRDLVTEHVQNNTDAETFEERLDQQRDERGQLQDLINQLD